MSDQMAIIAVAVLALVFFGLWSFNTKQNRKFDEAARQRRLKRERKQMQSEIKTETKNE